MPDKVLQDHHIAELSLRIVVSVVVIVNILITIAATALWRSFRTFKDDQRESLRNFVSGHVEKHEEVAHQINTLFERERETSNQVSSLVRGLEDQNKLCSDHRVNCSGRKLC